VNLSLSLVLFKNDGYEFAIYTRQITEHMMLPVSPDTRI
jgi:hypothetical protein